MPSFNTTSVNSFHHPPWTGIFMQVTKQHPQNLCSSNRSAVIAKADLCSGQVVSQFTHGTTSPGKRWIHRTVKGFGGALELYQVFLTLLAQFYGLGVILKHPQRPGPLTKICSPLLPLMQYPGSIKIHSLLASGITDDGILQAKLTLLFQDWQMSETLEIW